MCIPFLLCLLFLLLKRDPTTALLWLYSISSIIMLITRVYFAYCRRMPSFGMLGEAGLLGDVGNTILDLLKSNHHLLYIVDLPLIIIFRTDFAADISRRLRGCRPVRRTALRATSAVCAVMVCLSVITVAVSGIFYDFKAEYLKNGFYSYYVLDAVNTLFPADNSAAASDFIYASGDDITVDKEPLNAIAAGRNVITIQVEAMQHFVIGLVYNGQEVTPNLNALLKTDTLYFENYYYVIGGGNTADAEFAVNNSLYAPSDKAAYIKYTENDYYGLSRLLKSNNYTGAYAFHGYIGSYWNREAAYPYQGFDDYMSYEDFDKDEIVGMGIGDTSFFGQTVDYLKKQKQPFYAFLVTLSSHYPYTIPDKCKELELLDEDKGTLVGDYLQAMHYVDKSFGALFEDLKSSGLYENSVISIYGDHYAIPSTDPKCYEQMNRILGHLYYENDIFRVPMIIHIPGSDIGQQTIDVSGSHLDYLPTILYLLGIKNDRSVMFGQNLLKAEKGMVYEQVHIGRGSFISDDYIYCFPYSGIVSNAVLYDKADGQRVSDIPPEVFEISKDAQHTYDVAMGLLDSNSVLINQDAAEETTAGE